MGVPVYTRKGKQLESLQGFNPTAQCHSGFDLLQKRHGGNWRLRKPPCGGYNCAGLVWASRRAVLPSPTDWKMILEDDGYRKLTSREPVMPGDVVTYFERRTDEILHVARICFIRKLRVVGDGDKEIPWALSKWHATSGESVHAVGDVPPFQFIGSSNIDWQIYTDRP